jgi:hypothetical protein
MVSDGKSSLETLAMMSLKKLSVWVLVTFPPFYLGNQKLKSGGEIQAGNFIRILKEVKSYVEHNMTAACRQGH